MELFPTEVKGEVIRENDHLSVEYLFTSNYARLCYFAFKIIGDRETAEDLVQEAFIKLWQQQENFSSEFAARTFLYVSVRNSCMNRLRREGVEKKYLKTQNADGIEYEKGLHRMIQAEVLGEIHKAIEQLPQGCRKVLKLAYFEGLKNHEIAEQLGTSVNTIKTQKARALQLLRLKLDVAAFASLLIILSKN